MKIAVLGTGIVGNTIGSKLIEVGHEVRMGSRKATNEKASQWVQSAGSKASQGTFAEAAAFGEIILPVPKEMLHWQLWKLPMQETFRTKS